MNLLEYLMILFLTWICINVVVLLYAIFSYPYENLTDHIHPVSNLVKLKLQISEHSIILIKQNGINMKSFKLPPMSQELSLFQILYLFKDNRATRPLFSNIYKTTHFISILGVKIQKNQHIKTYINGEPSNVPLWQLPATIGTTCELRLVTMPYHSNNNKKE